MIEDLISRRGYFTGELKGICAVKRVPSHCDDMIFLIGSPRSDLPNFTGVWQLLYRSNDVIVAMLRQWKDLRHPTLLASYFQVHHTETG